MDLLVLDTIHGGALLGDELRLRGHRVETVDVYRGSGLRPDPAEFDHVIAPVHLDPDHPLLADAGGRILTHHEAVGLCLADHRPDCLVEVTGARGKTTTAFAIAAVMEGPGVLHTSAGTWQYPERRRLWRSSITPATVLPAARAAAALGGWCVAEESLGVTGAGDLAVLTSTLDYTCAAGKRSALACKLDACRRAPRLLVPGGDPLLPGHPALFAADDLAQLDGDRCATHRGTVASPLIGLPAYGNAIRLAAAAAAILGCDAGRLATLQPVPGRLATRDERGHIVVDDANSGTTRSTAVEAALYARTLDPAGELRLVIGEEHRVVCEGFAPSEVAAAIAEIAPATAVLVGAPEHRKAIAAQIPALGWSGRLDEADTLGTGLAAALAVDGSGPIVLAVKTWR